MTAILGTTITRKHLGDLMITCLRSYLPTLERTTDMTPVSRSAFVLHTSHADEWVPGVEF